MHNLKKTATLLTIGVLCIPAIFWVLANHGQQASTVFVRTLGTTLPERIPSLRLERDALEPCSDARPRITNVNVVDLDRDGRSDILICDAVRHTIRWRHQGGDSNWITEALLPENSLAAPAHTSLADIDADGDIDILVAVLRNVWPTDGRHGQVVALVNDGTLKFSSVVLADDLRRVTDVQPADFDRDGDVDLAVAEFGYLHGRTLWLENMGGLHFRDHELQSLPGAIHCPIADYDLDGDPDIAVVVSQNDEEVWLFENTGAAAFSPTAHKVWSTTNYDQGLAGMVTCDLDQDGDTDLLLSAGDNLEFASPCPQPGHGCIWLENQGGREFVAHRIASLSGTYAADSADLDGDGDMDVVLASMFNDWQREGTTSLAWLENDGTQSFTAWHLASNPNHLCTVSCGDLNGDGLPDIVAGSLQIFPPYEISPSRIAIWESVSTPSEQSP